MTRTGTSKRPAVVRVQTQARAQEILSICERNDWKVIVGIEPDKTEDVSDVERLLHPPAPAKSATAPGRNDPCPCGSGRKYKKCCGGSNTPAVRD
jgi:SWIM/SEC-C metal-binding protein